MSASATERTAFVYLTFSAFVAFFGGVYEHFSHGVWSPWMVYAFAFPLLLGALPFSFIALLRKHPPRPWTCRLHHAGVAALTVGSMMEGVLKIYGTTNQLTIIYWLAGGTLLIFAQLYQHVRK